MFPKIKNAVDFEILRQGVRVGWMNAVLDDEFWLLEKRDVAGLPNRIRGIQTRRLLEASFIVG